MTMSPAVPSVDWVSVAGNFVLVLVLLAAVLWGLRKIQDLQGKGFKSSDRRLQIIETLSVGPRQKLALVRVDEREVLVGITPGQFTTLDGWSTTVADRRAAPALWQRPDDINA